MTFDGNGVPVCHNCGRRITQAFRADHGQSFVLACEPCGIEDKIPISQLRAEQQGRRERMAA